MKPGSWAAVLKGLKAYGERIKNRKAEQITREDMVSGGCALISVFIREPQFVGQDQGPPCHRGSREMWWKTRCVTALIPSLAADPKSAGLHP